MAQGEISVTVTVKNVEAKKALADSKKGVEDLRSSFEKATDAMKTASEAKSLKELRDSIRQMTNAAVEFQDTNTELYNQLQVSIAQAKDRMADLREEQAVLAGSGFEILTRAVGRFREGLVNLDLPKVTSSFTLLKTGIMTLGKEAKTSFMQASNSVGLAVQNMLGLGKGAESAAMGFKVLGVAITGLGLTAIIGLVSTLLFQFDNLKSSGGAVGRVFTFIGDTVKTLKDGFLTLTDAIGLTDVKASEIAEKLSKENKEKNAELKKEQEKEVEEFKKLGEKRVSETLRLGAAEKLAREQQMKEIEKTIEDLEEKRKAQIKINTQRVLQISDDLSKTEIKLQEIEKSFEKNLKEAEGTKYYFRVKFNEKQNERLQEEKDKLVKEKQQLENDLSVAVGLYFDNETKKYLQLLKTSTLEEIEFNSKIDRIQKEVAEREKAEAKAAEAAQKAKEKAEEEAKKEKERIEKERQDIIKFFEEEKNTFLTASQAKIMAYQSEIDMLNKREAELEKTLKKEGSLNEMQLQDFNNIQNKKRIALMSLAKFQKELADKEMKDSIDQMNLEFEKSKVEIDNSAEVLQSEENINKSRQEWVKNQKQLNDETFMSQRELRLKNLQEEYQMLDERAQVLEGVREAYGKLTEDEEDEFNTIQKSKLRTTKKIAEEEKAANLEKAQFGLGLAAEVANFAAVFAGQDFETQKAISVGQAIINTALAVTKAIATPDPTDEYLVGAQGAVQIATILAQQPPQAQAIQAPQLGSTYAKGGILQGPSHAMGGIPTSLGELEGGEAVINRRSTAMFAPLLSEINAMGGGKEFNEVAGSNQTTGTRKDSVIETYVVTSNVTAKQEIAEQRRKISRGFASRRK